MTKPEALKKALESETENERLDFIRELADSPERTGRDEAVWRLINVCPNKREIVTLATSVVPSRSSDATWALISQLIREPDQDVIGNALNSMTFSGNRALGHRALHFFSSRERPQRVLYCLARYAEEAIDQRFGHLLSSAMESDLSDAFLARSFNALFRLGTKDKLAIRVAMDLITSHIDATNMDRKAAVAAMVYLCFAGDRYDIEHLRLVQNKVTIPELRRLLNWGLHELHGFEIYDFNTQAAEFFLKRAANLAEPNYTGYGCFQEATLLEGAKKFLDAVQPEEYAVATRTILALGSESLSDLLATNPNFGLNAIRTKDFGELKLIWMHFLPTNSAQFAMEIRNPETASYWLDRETDLLSTILEKSDFLAEPNSSQAPWQDRFEKLLRTSTKDCISLLVCQLIILEKMNLEGANQSFNVHAASFSSTKEIAAFENLILANIEAVKDRPLNQMNASLLDDLREAIYGTLIGGYFRPEFALKIYERIPFGILEWTFSAACAGRDELCEALATRAMPDQVSLMEGSLSKPNLAAGDVEEWVLSVLQGLTVQADRHPRRIPKELLSRIDSVVATLQAVFDAIGESALQPEIDTDNSEDWGQAIEDKPLLRCNAVLQAIAADTLSSDRATELEGPLKDALRVAPHVEKRWVITALVRVGTDDAIKAVLYQALQHVDLEHVGHTIRMLLKSSHRRAQQALIRCVGRNTIPDDIKLTILEEMSLANPQDLLSELKTLEILRLAPHIDDAIRDAMGRVSSLIDDKQSDVPLPNEGLQSKLASTDVDGIIRGFLPESELLSVDVRSALRTAEMILIQSQEWGDQAVDLSPIVNMHTKAVELTLRETFEPYTDAVIRRGELGRKLDILGYARPIPEKMQIFEDFLAQLPVIKTIPYFSKFKLRKMLRAICLYRPGKRFTLDGPKAFALLFLVGSRRDCPFGLAQTVPLHFDSDAELFQWIKLVHSLQDSRNRAVHEGLTWEAQDEIESMRKQAYQIIAECMRQAKEIRKRQGRAGSGLVGVGA